MTHSETSVALGRWLFNRRGWLPLYLFILATLALLLSRRDEILDNTWALSIGAFGISLIGLTIRVIVIGYAPEGTSQRGVHQPQARILNTRGAYSIVRNPLYIGNFFMWLGVTLYVGVDWFLVAVVLLFWIYYEKIILAEEEYLLHKFGTQYVAWCNRVHAVIPTWRHYQPSLQPFSWRKTVRNEYYGVLGLIFSFGYINIVKELRLYDSWHIGSPWGITLLTALCALALLSIRKYGHRSRRNRIRSRMVRK